MSLSHRPRILIVAPPSGGARKNIENLQLSIPQADIVIADDTRESILSIISGTHALIGCPRPLFDNEILEKAGKSLRWIHVSGAGCEEFLIEEMVKSDVILTTGKIIQGPEVADHALALLLTLTRNIHYVLRGSLGNAPRPTDQVMSRPIELRKKTALVVGLGGVGMLVSERLSACGMKVIGVNPDYVPMLRMFEKVYPPERLKEALPLADVVVMTAPMVPGTEKMFGREEFLTMKEQAYFINVSRGKTVDTEALTQIVMQGRFKGVGLDVTDPEPLAHDHLLRGLQNVVITPHIAGPSDHNRERSLELIKNNIERFVKDLPLINVIDKKLGY